MKKLVTILALTTLALAISGTASALLLTFDDVSTTTTYAWIPDGYGGFDWGNMGVVETDLYAPGTGYDFGTVSEDYVAFNAYGDPGSIIVSAGDGFPLFDFEGAYLTAAWNTGLNIDVVGYLGASEVYNQTVVVDPWGPTWFDFDYYDIDRLVFTSYGGADAFPGIGGDHGTHFAMDNFDFTPVPEPTTMLMLGGLGAGLASARKLRKKK